MWAAMVEDNGLYVRAQTAIRAWEDADCFLTTSETEPARG